MRLIANVIVEPFNDEMQDLLYKAGYIVFFTALSLGFFIAMNIGLKNIALPTCVFLQKTGLPCPACGGTRAVIALFRGNIAQSFLFHPVVPYTAAVYIIFMSSMGFSRCILHRKAILFKLAPVHFLAVPAILFLNWILRLVSYLIG